MILLDYDVVDATNLNRQILFSKQHVGMRKVDAAKEGIQMHLIGETEVEVMHVDAVKEWGKVVEVARGCTVLFNNIDVGYKFDFACLSLAKSLDIPYAAGSSYARTWIVEYYSGRPEKSSFSLVNKEGDLELLKKLDAEHIQGYDSLAFVPKDDNPPTRLIGSNVLVCTSAGVMTVNAWVQGLNGFEMPGYTKFDIVSFKEPGDTLAWPEPEDEDYVEAQKDAVAE